MKFLIGVLILLFFVTTLGFSELAFANTCNITFEEPTPDLNRESQIEYLNNAQFVESSNYFFEGQRRPQDMRSWDEFGQYRESSEFEYNQNF